MLKITKCTLLVAAIFFVPGISAQESFITLKPTVNSIGIRMSLPAFNNLLPIANGWFNLLPKNYLAESSVLLKLRKHELSAGILVCMNSSKKIIAGESVSYLYHFSQNKIHPFLEVNGNFLKYTCPPDGFPVPYNQNSPWPTNGSAFSDAKVRSTIVNAALGVEAKIWKVIFCQLAVGEGYYMVNAKMGLQSPASMRNLDPYYLFNFYGKHSGSNWYARFSLVFRLHHF